MLFTPRWWMEADKGSGGGGSGEQGSGNQGSGDQGQGQDGGKPLVYDEWFKGQPDKVRVLLETNTKGLKTALDSERDARKKLEKDLREMAGKAEKDSDAQKRLTEMADQMGEADRKADFYEAAHAAGVSNLKLAFMIATADEMFDRRGQVNFETMKANYPEMFGGKPSTTVKGNAGSGTNNNQTAGSGMNDFIRKAAGRQ